MLLHYFYKKENKEKNYVNEIYLQNLRLSVKFIQTNKYILKKDFQSSFEIFSLFLIFHLKNLKDFKMKNYIKINQELMDLFVNDLDYSFREIGIGDIKIGKYVKTYVKKFYFRLSTMDEILNINDLNKLAKFISKLNIIKKDKINEASKEILSIYLKIQSTIENNSKLDKIWVILNNILHNILYWICGFEVNMAVPKRKTSKSKRNMRRSHDSLKFINVVEDKESGEPRISHRIDLSTGMYNGRQVLKQKNNNN